MVSKSELKRKYERLIRKESRLLRNSMLKTGMEFKKSERQRSKINKTLRQLHGKIQSKQEKRRGIY